MSKSKEICTLAHDWNDLELHKNAEGLYVVKNHLWRESNLTKGEGQVMFEYLLEHYGLEYCSSHGMVCAVVETIEDLEDALERMSDFEAAISELHEVMDEDQNIKMDEAEEALDRDK